MTRRRGTGPISVVMVEGFFSRLSFGLLSFSLPLYAHHLGMSLSAIGVLLSVNMAVAVALKPAMGWVVDRYGVRFSYIAACLLRSGVLLTLIFVTTPVGLFTARAMHGVSIALRDPASGSVLAVIGGKKAVAQRFAWYQSAKTVAGSVGQFLAGLLISALAQNYQVVFAIAAALSLLPLLAVILGLRGTDLAELTPESRRRLRPLGPRLPHRMRLGRWLTRPRTTLRARLVTALMGPPMRVRFGQWLARERPTAAQRLGAWLLHRSARAETRTDQVAGEPVRFSRVAPFAGLGFMITGTAYMMSNLLPVLVVEHLGLTAVAAGSLYLMTAIISLSGPVWGWVADRVSLQLVLGVRAVGNVFSSLVWLLIPSYAGLVAGKAFDDVGKAAFRPAWGSMTAQVANLEPRRRGRTLSWLSSAEDAGEMVGPVAAGLIWGTFGLPALLLTRAGLGVITEIYALILARRSRLRSNPDQG